MIIRVHLLYGVFNIHMFIIIRKIMKAPVNTVFVMRKEEIPDRKSDSVLDLKVSFKFIDFL